MKNDLLGKCILYFALLLSASISIFIIFCIFKFGLISTIGWIATIYLIIFILSLFMRDFCQETIGEK